MPITAYDNNDDIKYDAEITHPQFVPIVLENICVHKGRNLVLNVDMVLKTVNPEKNKIIILSCNTLTIPENQNAIQDEIIKHYYGDSSENTENQENIDTYSENPLIPGTSGNMVKALKIQLNRIGRNYPAIPLLDTKSGDFDLETQKAVSVFQNIFGLEQNGAADKATRNKIKVIYSDIKKLNELLSESVYYKNVQNIPPEEQKEGSTGRKVKYIQYFLSLIGYFNESIPAVKHSGIYDNPTKDAVLTLQREYDLFQDGITGRETWNKLLNLYFDLTSSLPQAYSEEKADVFPGYVMTRGMRDNNINKLQKYLELICEDTPEIPKPDQNGYYGNQTFSAVKEFQKKYNLKQTGATGAITWNKISEIYGELKNI
ncbi:MAG TPA: peptidoglycan-binding protein [Oscillospiraceae bacterium]|nr:peptidoglycan-binding protein [Oscillospiraceae bacterium]